MNPIPVIIDCDPGIDDAFALALAASSKRLSIRAITTVSGNVRHAYTSENALRIAGVLGLTCPVAKGADKPIIGEPRYAAHVHGEDGLGGAKLPENKQGFAKEHAWDLIYKIACEHVGELQLITLAPLTNIAIALLKYPDLKAKLHSITMMGGSTGKGNMSPYAEFNVWADPYACDIVFKSGIPITMVGLDVTRKVFMDESDFELVLSKKSPALDMLRVMWEFTRWRTASGGRAGHTNDDVLAVAAVINPDVIHTTAYYGAVELHGKLTEGQTVIDLPNRWKKEPNLHVAMEVDKRLYMRMLTQMTDTLAEQK